MGMEIHQLKQLLEQNSLFNSLDPSTLQKIATQLEVVNYQLGDIIIRKGDISAAFYLIVKGKGRVVDDATTAQPITLAILTLGAYFGHESLLSKTPARSSVRAAGNVTLVKLPARDFSSLLEEFPHLRNTLEAQQEKQTEFQFLRTLNPFFHLSLPQSQQLAEAIEVTSIPEEEFLFREGEPVNGAYIIRRGGIRLLAKNTILAILKPGDICGETALLNHEPYPVSALAAEDTLVWRLNQPQIAHSQIQQHMTQLAENRQWQQEAILASRDTPSPSSQPKLVFRRVKVGKKWWDPHYPFVAVDNPLLSGIACLAAINRFHSQKIDLQPLIQRQLSHSQSDNLISVSHKADSLGYITRLLYLNNEGLDKPTLPAIIENDLGELCLLLKVTPTQVILANPLTKIHVIDRKEFISTWNGKLLTVNLVPNFANIGTQTLKIFQQFIPLARPYWSILTWIAIITLILQLLGAVGPLFSQIIIDQVVVNGDYSLLFLMLLGMLFVTGFQLASSALREFLVVRALKQISVSLLLRFLDHILSLPKAIFSKWQVGDFTVRFQENEKLLQLVAQSGFKVIIDSITIVFYLVILLNKNAKLTGIALIFVAAYGLTIFISTPLLRANDRRVFEKKRELESHLIETVSSIETIKAIATEKLFFQQGVNRILKTQLAEFKGALIAFNIGLISNLINQASIIVILGYGAFLVITPTETGQNQLTPGELVAFNGLLGLLLTPLQSLIGVWDELQEMRISFERVNDVLVLPSEEQNRDVIFPPIQGRVRLEHVCFSYEGSESHVLTDINLEVASGEKIALVGKSGSGKTTLANLLTRLLQPTQGTILVDGIDLGNIDLSSYRRQLGVVEQNPFLFSGTIRENIAKANPNADLDTVVAAAKLAGADEFIDSFPLKYDTQIGERGMTLSGGQRQRLVIARALLADPSILILDEPTAALDSESERIMLENLEQQVAGRTTFMIAHRLSTVKNSDRIIVIDQGCIVEMGTHEELLSQQGLYYQLNNS